MKVLAGRVRDIRHHPIVVEESPEYDPQPNGLVERCMQSVNGMFKTLRASLDRLVGRPVPDGRPILARIICQWFELGPSRGWDNRTGGILMCSQCEAPHANRANTVPERGFTYASPPTDHKRRDPHHRRALHPW